MKYTKKNMKKTYKFIFTIAIFIAAVFSSLYISKQEERSSLDIDYLKEEKNVPSPVPTIVVARVVARVSAVPIFSIYE